MITIDHLIVVFSSVALFSQVDRVLLGQVEHRVSGILNRQDHCEAIEKAL